MFRKHRLSLTAATLLVILTAGAANAIRVSRGGAATALVPQKHDEPGASASPCANALARGTVCMVANVRALAIMQAGNFEAFIVVQDVGTGALVAFAASQPARLDVSTSVLPLSVVKLLLAASWWDHQLPDSTFDSFRGTADKKEPGERLISIHEMIVNGSDNAGRQMALGLRKSIGTEAILGDFKRYGFGESGPSDNQGVWRALAPRWRTRLNPGPAYVSLTSDTKDPDWADTLSIGESNMMVTGLHVSRFLQAIGNDGVMLPASALLERPENVEQQPPAGVNRRGLRRLPADVRNPNRVMEAATAQRLQAAMRDVVQRGTAKSIANSLADSGWQIGGKTGTGPGPAPIGPQSDGWFAGLIFDRTGKARFTVATFVRHGGTGGGNAARISADLARYIVGKGVL